MRGTQNTDLSTIDLTQVRGTQKYYLSTRSNTGRETHRVLLKVLDLTQVWSSGAHYNSQESGFHPPLITMLSVTGESFLIKGMFSSSLIPTSSTLTVPIGLVSIIFGASGSFPAMVHKKHKSLRQILHYNTEHITNFIFQCWKIIQLNNTRHSYEDNYLKKKFPFWSKCSNKKFLDEI